MIDSLDRMNDNKMQEPFILTIFGGTGDLAKRKLIPALYNLIREGSLPQPFAVVGVSRRVSSLEEFRNVHEESVARFSRSQPLDSAIWDRLANSLYCLSGDVHAEETYRKLQECYEEIDRGISTRGNRIFYFSTPAQEFPLILTNLSRSGLVNRGSQESAAPWTRIIVEKPFGRDLPSARQLNQSIQEVLSENQVFRIDHYLGKETVQNILVFRYGNSIFEHLWNRKYVDHVQISAMEDIGIEGRANFYEGTGVFRDVVQNHLLEILALCAMEMPVSFAADDIRDQKLHVLRSLRPLLVPAIGSHVIAGQYNGYQSEPGVASDSRTPTYAALKVMIDNWRWQGVPFYLRAGKGLKRRGTEIAIHFQPIPFCLFGREDVCQRIDPNILLLRIQPNEGISLRFVCKEPGDQLQVSNVFMDFQYATAFPKQPAEAYERLLLDCIRGDLTLFARKDAIEKAWEFLDPILLEIENNTRFPIHSYEKGSAGPTASIQLLQRDGRSWYEG